MDQKRKNTLDVSEQSVLDLEKIDLEALIEKNPEVLEKIHQQTQITEVRKHHSGPIPDPETLKQYKAIYKNAPEVIFNMANNEQSFRHVSTYLGQISALLIGLGGLVVTAYLGVNNQPWLAGIISFGSLGSLVGIFLHRQKK